MNSTKRKSKKNINKPKVRKMKGGNIDELLDTILTTPNLISHCPNHKQKFGDLFISQQDCDNFFLNLLGRVKLMTILLDKLPKEVRILLTQDDIINISAIIDGEVSDNIHKYALILELIINELYSFQNIIKIASSKYQELVKEMNQNPLETIKAMELVKELIRVYCGLSHSSNQAKKVLAKNIFQLIKLASIIPKSRQFMNKTILNNLEIEIHKRLSYYLLAYINFVQTGSLNIQSGGGIDPTSIIVGLSYGIFCIMMAPICLAVHIKASIIEYIKARKIEK